jgi:hypothetical protein
MLPWANVLPSRGLLRSHRAWCPLCYAEWRTHGQAIHEPLIWSLEIVTVCARHWGALCAQCPSCQAYLLPLEAQSRPGYCSYCGQWLGSDSEGDAAELRESRQNVSRAVWVATAVGALLAQAPFITAPPARERIAAVVTRYVLHAGGGNNAALARLLGCSKYTIRDCCRGAQLLQLKTLLKLSETVGVSLLRLLTDETLLTHLPPIPSPPPEQPLSYHGSYRQVDKAQLRYCLQVDYRTWIIRPNP